MYLFQFQSIWYIKLLFILLVNTKQFVDLLEHKEQNLKEEEMKINSIKAKGLC